VLTRADLAALEISRRTVDPGFVLTPDVAGTSYLVNVGAAEYLTAVDEYGSPAYTPAELATAPAAGRRQADVVLANALPVVTEFEADPASLEEDGRCREVRAGAGGSALRLAPGVTAIELPAGPPGAIRLRRFATGEYPLETEVGGGTTTLLRIPRDGAARRWRLQVDAVQGASVCD
jgi:hypothetical protein